MNRSMFDSARILGATDLSILCAIHEYVEDHRHSPSMRELGDMCYIHHSTVTRYVRKLCKVGFLTRIEGAARSVALVYPYQDVKIAYKVWRRLLS